MTQTHAYCPVHHIGYNLSLDPTCPQCTQAGIFPPVQYEFDIIQQKPVDGAGKALERSEMRVERQGA